MSKPRSLELLAKAAGIQTEYIDNTGNPCQASAESLEAVLNALGFHAASEPQRRDALREVEHSKKAQLSEPVQVCWQGTDTVLPLNCSPAKLQRAEIQLEEGNSIDLLLALKNQSASRSSRIPHALPLPALPLGFHKLKLSAAGSESEVLLISAPQKIYLPSNTLRQWGIFLPLYAAHSKNSWGSGNFTDWKNLGKWLRSQGGQVMASLPILPAFLDYPTIEPSPYSPASRLFWNEFFIDITAIPEFKNFRKAKTLVSNSRFQQQIARFRSNNVVDYPGEWKIRKQALALLAADFFKNKPPRYKRLEKYLAAWPSARDYATFRALCEQRQTGWQSWKDSAAASWTPGKDFDPKVRDLYLFAQWTAQEQMNKLLEQFNADQLRFYLDLPLGVNPDSFDAWRHADYFANNASAGAPPDSFFTKGQDWGFAPLHPQRIRQLHYQYVIDYLDFQMRHTGMLRIDHVMGLHRLYWVPKGNSARAGAYVRYHAEELYAILTLQSHRHKTMLIGENLGTVPPEVNECMDRHGLRRMYVLQYEQRPHGPLSKPERAVAASLNTHDMPTFAAHWQGADIADRADLGLIPKSAIHQENQSRDQLRQNLIQTLRRKKLLSSKNPHLKEVLCAAIKFLSDSPAETVLVNLEDLWLETRPQNTPGTCAERVNWRGKAALPIEALRQYARTDPEIRHLLQHLAGRAIRRK